MFFSNNGRPDYDKINVNTNVTTFWSDISSLNVGCWNDKINFSWLPAAGKSERGYTQYNKDARVQTSVPHTKLSVLLKRYEKRIKEKYENGEDPGEKGISVGIPLTPKDGTLSILLIQYMRDESGKPTLYFTLARKMTESGTAPENIIRYKFNKLTVFDDFIPETATGTQSEEDGEFEFFISILQAHILMTGLIAHPTRYSAAFGKRGEEQAATTQAPMIGDQPDFSGMASDDFSVFS